jgi:hypothetical protein
VRFRRWLGNTLRGAALCSSIRVPWASERQIHELRLSFVSQVPKLARNGTVSVSVVRAGKSDRSGPARQPCAGPVTLVFRRKDMIDATETLMGENGISCRGNDDVLAVWNGKVTASR